jgi:hypothetical protein
VEHGAITVRHSVLSPATDNLPNAALLQLYGGCKASWVGAIPISGSLASASPDTIRDKTGNSVATQIMTVADFLENKILNRAGIEDTITWTPKQRREAIQGAIGHLKGLSGETARNKTLLILLVNWGSVCKSCTSSFTVLLGLCRLLRAIT